MRWLIVGYQLQPLISRPSRPTVSLLPVMYTPTVCAQLTLCLTLRHSRLLHTGLVVCLLLYQCNAYHENKITRSSADADNRLDAFSGQSRSTNMVPFHMLHIFSHCAIVTLSLRRAVFTIFVFKKYHDLEMGSKVTQGH